MNLLFNNRSFSIASKILVGCFIVLAYGLIQSHSAYAGTCTFASTEPTNNWKIAANWGCGGVPTSTSPVVIPAATTTYILADAAATAGSVTITGTLKPWGSTLSINGNWTRTGTFTAGTSTVDFTGTAAQTINSVTTFNNVTVTKASGTVTAAAAVTINGTLATTGGGTLDMQGNALSVALTTAIGALTTVTSTSGTLTFTGAVTNSGAIGSVDGGKMFGSTLANSGTLNIGSGVATSTGTLDNSGGTINGDTGTLILLANFVSPAPGTFNSGTGTVRLGGGADQSIRGYEYNNVEVFKTGGTATLTGANALFGGTLFVAGGTLSAGAANLLVLNNTTIIPGGTVTSTTGLLDFFSAVGNSGNVGSSSGDIVFEADLINNGTLNVGSGTVTTTMSIFSIPGIINGNSGTLVITDSWPTGGTFNRGSGTVRYVGATPQDVRGEYIYNNLVINKSAGTATLDGHATTTNFTLSAGTLAVVNKIFSAQGTYINHGLVTRTTGSIKHAASYKNFVNASGVTQTSYTTPGAIYLEVKDDNRNMNGALAETLTIPLVVNAAGGGDSETVTLTETGVATGVFRSGLIGLYTGTSIVPGNGEVVISASGIGTETYTDNQDPADTGATTATLTYSTGAAAPRGGGGGGGGLPPVVTHYETGTSDPNRSANLANLSSMGLDINTLVKLPDDGNISTQEDSAVYYISSDGKRHAFPNSKVYFTWYSNFDKVKVITSSQLASIPLGANVRYKPGSKMIKFTTDIRVFAIDLKGTLRFIKSEDVAKALYGADWNTKIDDMSDAFFGSYSFGADINSSADFDVSKVMASEQNISEDF